MDAPTTKSSSKATAGAAAPSKLSLGVPAGATKPLAFLFLIAIGVLLWWGVAVQRPSLDPFTERDWRDWFTEPTPDPAYGSLPIRPLFSGRGWLPKELLSAGSDTESNRLRALGPGAVQVLPDDRFPTLATWAATSQDGKHVGLIGADGRVYISGKNGWEAFDLTAVGLGDNQSPVQQQPPTGSEDASSGDDSLRTLKGHRSWVLSVAFSPDGALLASASIDNSLRLWETASGKPLRTLKGHQGQVSSVAFSPDGTLLASASIDNSLRLWETASGKPLRTLQGHQDPVISVAFSPDGTLLAGASLDNSLRLWETASGKPLRTLQGHQSREYSVAFSPDGALLAGASFDNSLRLWETASGKPLRTLQGHRDPVTSVAFSPDGTLLASASDDMTLRLWETASGKPLRTLQGHRGSVTSMAFSPDGALLASASDDMTLRLWETASGKPLRTLEGHQEQVSSVAFSPDGVLLAGASKDHTVRLWVVPGSTPPIRAATFDQRGSFCLTDGSIAWACRDPVSGVWEPGSVRTFSEVVAMSYRPDSTLVALRKDSVARVYSSSADQIPKDLPEGAELRNLAFLDNERGWIIGTEGLILETTDGGESWTEARRSSGESLSSIHIDPAGGGWIDGEREGRRFVLHKQDLKGDGPWRRLGHHTAPWVFFAGVPLLLLAGFVNLRLWTAQPPVVRESIEGTASSDRPLSWADKDALDLKPMALGLSRFLRNVNTVPPLTLAVTGGWGSGKSSLMNLLMSDLQRYGARPVWFNAWHHRDETHLLAALLENIRAQAIPAWYTWPGVTFRQRLLWLRTRGTLLNLLAIGAFLAIAWWVVEMALEGPFDMERFKTDFAWLVSAKTWLETPLVQSTDLTRAKGLGGLMTLVLVLILRSKLVALPANPAKLLSDVSKKASLRDFSDKLSFRYRFGQEFRDVCETLRTRRNPGLVILIDDLDRCQPEAVLKVLEAVNYFVSEGPCFVVLGMDRRQVEHAVGHGFKDIVEGLPEEELIYGDQLRQGNSDEETRVIKRRAYARHYLEKLINIDVAVPTLSSDGAVRMLVDAPAEPDPEKNEAVRHQEPAWLAGFKQQVWTLLGVARVAVFSVAIGLGAALLLEPYVGTSPPATRQPELTEPSAGAETETTAETTAPQVSVDETPKEEVVRFGEAIPLELLAGMNERVHVPSARRYLWWGGTAFVILIALLFGAAEVVRRERSVVRDSPDFATALAIVLPLIHAANPTPRAVKLYENRMRYLATRLGAAAQPRDPDLVDRVLHWWGQKRGKQYVPPAWFETPEPLLSEPKLLMLGALETYVPKVFKLPPKELDALAESKALRELETRGEDGEEVLLATVSRYAMEFGKNPRNALQAADFATYEKRIRRL